MFAKLRRRARRKWGVPAEQCGAVPFIQPFGSALNLNVRFHTLVLEGVYLYALSRDRPPRFLGLGNQNESPRRTPISPLPA